MLQVARRGALSRDARDARQQQRPLASSFFAQSARRYRPRSVASGSKARADAHGRQEAVVRHVMSQVAGVASG